MSVRLVRCGVILVATMACVFAALSGVAAAGAASSQPELAPFVIAKTGNDPVADAIGPNHTFVIVYSVKGVYKVCVLARGASTCESTATLTPLDNDSLFGAPQLHVSGDDVSVLMDQCCAAQPETPLIFTSTDGGKTFGTPVFVGDTNNANVTQNDDSTVFADGDLVWDGGTNATIDAVSLANPDDNEQTAGSVVPNGSGDNELEYSGLGTYKGGVLVAASNFGNPPSTTVYYAPAGHDPGRQSSYHAVGTFANATFEFLEGGALVTELNTGRLSDQIRMFNGTNFGSAHTIPYTDGGGPRYDSGGRSATGRTYIFTERNQDNYRLEVESTDNGSTWSGRTDLGPAAYAYSFNAALDGTDSGIIVGSPNPIKVYPVLARQSVSFSLSKSKVTTGTDVTARGTGHRPAAGRRVRLQRLESGHWRDRAITTESASGKFTFHLRENSAGTYTFRAVAVVDPGYVQYGYSSRRSLKVTRPRH